MLVASCALLAVLAIAMPPRWSVAVAVAAGAAFGAWTRTSTGVLASSALLALAWCVGTIVRLRRVRALDAERALEESVSAADARREAAVLEERAHLAREIHDVLAHSLSALAIQLERIRLEVSHLPGGSDAAEDLARAHELAARGLQDARGAISALRGDRSVRVEDLTDLVTEFRASTGIDARFDPPDHDLDLTLSDGLLLYRALQESLTNAARHATPTTINASIASDADAVTLRVVNDGVDAGQEENGSGYGIQGIRERVALAAGTVEARAIDGGRFEVLVCLPR